MDKDIESEIEEYRRKHREEYRNRQKKLHRRWI